MWKKEELLVCDDLHIDVFKTSEIKGLMSDNIAKQDLQHKNMASRLFGGNHVPMKKLRC